MLVKWSNQIPSLLVLLSSSSAAPSPLLVRRRGDNVDDEPSSNVVFVAAIVGNGAVPWRQWRGVPIDVDDCWG